MQQRLMLLVRRSSHANIAKYLHACMCIAAEGSATEIAHGARPVPGRHMNRHWQEVCVRVVCSCARVFAVCGNTSSAVVLSNLMKLCACSQCSHTTSISLAPIMPGSLPALTLCKRSSQCAEGSHKQHGRRAPVHGGQAVVDGAKALDRPSWGGSRPKTGDAHSRVRDRSTGPPQQRGSTTRPPLALGDGSEARAPLM
jgi:hypothetical protein